MRKKIIGAALLAGSMLIPVGALADGGNWLARVRAIYINPSASSSPVTGVDVNSQTVPELDFSYFVNRHVALELILGTSRHEVTLNGTSLGKVSVLPPTLTLQYHFAPGAIINPYVGAGINYTRFYNVGLASGLGVDKNSWGGALQAGLDYALSKRTFLNLDVKKIYIKTDVKSGGAYLTTLKINPLVIGVGYGWRF